MPGGQRGQLVEDGAGMGYVGHTQGHGTVLHAAAAGIARSHPWQCPGSGLVVLLPRPEQCGLIFEPRPCHSLLKLSRVDVFGCSTKL